MALETFPELATNLIYSVLCLVPGFITLQAAQFSSSYHFDLDQFDKTTWSLVASGLSLSILYLLYVVWANLFTGRLTLIVSIDLQWTELVAVYPFLVLIAALIGYIAGRLVDRFRPSSDGRISTA